MARRWYWMGKGEQGEDLRYVGCPILERGRRRDGCTVVCGARANTFDLKKRPKGAPRQSKIFRLKKIFYEQEEGRAAIREPK